MAAVAPVPATSKSIPPELQRLLGRINEIGSLPEVTARIVATVENPNCTARDVHDAVRKDPALATKLLKVVNSAFYGLPAQVASLERAILMLGLSAVKNLALAASLSGLVRPGPVCDRFEARDLWRHSVAVGACARLLATRSKVAPLEEAFVAGLVHDLGLIVVHQLLGAQMQTIAEQCLATAQSYVAAEAAVLGADHQQFGAALAARWKFPPLLRHAIAYHHDPDTLQAEHRKPATLIKIADTLCCQAQYGYWLTAQTQVVTAEDLELVGLTAPVVEELLQILPERVAETEAIFADL